MSYPILYPSTETAFATNGIGMLSDAIGCEVTEERNGMYELQMRYPVTGVHFADIALRSLILAKPNPYDQSQPFRVYRITRPLNGIVTVYAEHISYDLAGVVVSPFTASGIQDAFLKLKTFSTTQHSFTFWTDKTTTANMSVATPTSLRSLLGGVQGSILDVYGGGDYKFDRFQVSLYGERGADHGVSIRYGKNLTDIQQEENCSNVYTGVYPYWLDTEGHLFELPEKIVNAEGTYNYTRILALDFSGDWQEKPTEAQLRSRAQQYIKANKIGVPTVSLEVSFVQLEQTEEYKALALFDRVSLCDTVTVVFPAMGVSATAKVVETVYNVLLGRYESVTIGDTKHTLADTIVEQSQQTDQKIEDTKTNLQKAIDKATGDITGNNGGYVVLHDSNGDKYPDELLVMDQPTIEEATHVWRWNQMGLGYSGTGYDGPYGTAITADGHIVANYVNTGDLTANVITTGILKSDDGTTFYLDLDAGVLKMRATSLSITAASNFTIGDQNLETYTQGKVDTLDKSLTQQEVFDRLTARKANQGIFLENGNLYINASMIHAGTLSADFLYGGTLTLGGSGNGNGVLRVLNASGGEVGRMDNAGLYAIAGTIGGFTIDSNSIYSGTKGAGTGAGDITLSTADFNRSINGTSRISLRFAIGSKFGVASDGTVYASGATIAGSITANSGTIGGFTINQNSLTAGSGNTAMSLSPNGLSIGNGNFRVSQSGDLYAKSGTFEGNIYAKNIKAGGDYGYVSGGMIGNGEIGSTQLSRQNVYGGTSGTGSIGSGAIGKDQLNSANTYGGEGTGVIGKNAIAANQICDNSITKEKLAFSISTPDLSGYATQDWVKGQGYVTSSYFGTVEVMRADGKSTVTVLTPVIK